MTNSADRCGRVSVSARDGARLAVTTFGRPDAPLTVVFVHGHCLHGQSWASVRRHLRSSWGDDVRLVSYDHRGHGNSADAPVETYTIDQLAGDLDAVIEAVVPTGPIVLVGHSMGGMVALVYARMHQEAIGPRVVGIALIASAAGGITELGLGRLLRGRAVTCLRVAAHHSPTVVQTAQRVGHVLSRLLARRLRGRPAQRAAAVAAALAGTTSVETMVSFLQSLIEFDERETLAVLAHIPSLVLCGTDDPMTPFEHSLAIAAGLPSSELVSVNGGSHSVILDRANEVASAVSALLRRVTVCRVGTDTLTSRVG